MTNAGRKIVKTLCFALTVTLLIGGSLFAQDKLSPPPPVPPHAVVKGRTMFIMQGRAPLPPPSPTGDVDVYFKSGENIHQTTSEKDGAYSIELPPGVYQIGWVAMNEDAKSVDPFDRSRSRRPMGKEITEIQVEAGKTYERDLPVLVMEIY